MDIKDMAKDVDKLDVEGKIEFITLTTLGGLKGVFSDNNFDDRQATLTLYYFLNRFVKHAWKGHKPSDVLLNAIEVIKATDDSSLPPTPKGSRYP
jgi:hypothetical protein